MGVFDVGVAKIPFPGHGPIEDLGTGADLVDPERNPPLEKSEGLAYAVAGDAAADRVGLFDERVDLAAQLVAVEVVEESGELGSHFRHLRSRCRFGKPVV